MDTTSGDLPKGGTVHSSRSHRSLAALLAIMVFAGAVSGTSPVIADTAPRNSGLWPAARLSRINPSFSRRADAMHPGVVHVGVFPRFPADGRQGSKQSFGPVLVCRSTARQASRALWSPLVRNLLTQCVSCSRINSRPFDGRVDATLVESVHEFLERCMAPRGDGLCESILVANTSNWFISQPIGVPIR